MIEPFYYLNSRNGMVALSIDEGETMMLPSGKVLSVRPEVWELEPEDLEDDLSLKQQAFLAHHKEKPPMDYIEQLAWKLRKGRLAVAKDFAQAPEPRKKAPASAMVVKSDFKD